MTKVGDLCAEDRLNGAYIGHMVSRTVLRLTDPYAPLVVYEGNINMALGQFNIWQWDGAVWRLCQEFDDFVWFEEEDEPKVVPAPKGQFLKKY